MKAGGTLTRQSREGARHRDGAEKPVATLMQWRVRCRLEDLLA